MCRCAKECGVLGQASGQTGAGRPLEEIFVSCECAPFPLSFFEQRLRRTFSFCFFYQQHNPQLSPSALRGGAGRKLSLLFCYDGRGMTIVEGPVRAFPSLFVLFCVSQRIRPSWQ